MQGGRGGGRNMTTPGRRHEDHAQSQHNDGPPTALSNHDGSPTPPRCEDGGIAARAEMQGGVWAAGGSAACAVRCAGGGSAARAGMQGGVWAAGGSAACGWCSS